MLVERVRDPGVQSRQQECARVWDKEERALRAKMQVAHGSAAPISNDTRLRRNNKPPGVGLSRVLLC